MIFSGGFRAHFLGRGTPSSSEFAASRKAEYATIIAIMSPTGIGDDIPDYKASTVFSMV